VKNLNVRAGKSYQGALAKNTLRTMAVATMQARTMMAQETIKVIATALEVLDLRSTGV
jgi:hypothetical protein